MSGEIGEKFGIFAVAFGVVGIAFGLGDMIGNFVESLEREFLGGLAVTVLRGAGVELRSRIGIGEEGSMDDQVSVAADGRGEMSVVGFGQAVMAEGFGGVTGAHERSQKANFECGADGKAVQQ